MEALAFTIDAACRAAAVSKSYLHAEIALGRLVARKRGPRKMSLASPAQPNFNIAASA